MTGSRSEELQRIVDESVAQCLNAFAGQGLRPDELAVSLRLLSGSDVSSAGCREDASIYPASIVKLFFAVAAYGWVEQGKLIKTAEFDRAMRDMLVDSSNDASSYIVDLITDTTSGPELPPDIMANWSMQRNLINNYFEARHYQDINVSQKPWSDGPYGRERIFVGGPALPNRNRLTTSATARLLMEIMLHQAIAPEHCHELLAYVHRDRSLPASGDDDQTHCFIGGILGPQAKFWSKAGWTSTVRHDALCLDLDHTRTSENAQDGESKKPESNSKLILVVFTTNHAKQPSILQTIGGRIINEIGGAKSNE